MNTNFLDKTEAEVFADKYVDYFKTGKYKKMNSNAKDTKIVMLLSFLDFHGLEKHFEQFEFEVRR